MDNVSLAQVCLSSFNEKDVECAKHLLFEAIPSKKKKITIRKNKGKISRDFDDIIDLFQSTDPELIPIFVARDLYKLPPVSFDHVDVTRLLKDLLVLQKEVNEVKEQYATKESMEALRRELSLANEKAVSCEPGMTYINTRRGANLMNMSSLECASGPMGFIDYVGTVNHSKNVSARLGLTTDLGRETAGRHSITEAAQAQLSIPLGHSSASHEDLCRSQKGAELTECSATSLGSAVVENASIPLGQGELGDNAIALRRSERLEDSLQM